MARKSGEGTCVVDKNGYMKPFAQEIRDFLDQKNGLESSEGDDIIVVDEKLIHAYRKIMDDFTTSSELIIQRLEYLNALCRNIIRSELKISQGHE